MLNDVLKTLNFLHPSTDDDWSDRLNWYYTTTLLIILSLLISYKSFSARPIECWLPYEFKGSWEHYTGKK